MNKFNPDIHQRRSVRLKDYDYSQAGGYFVTICTQEREYLFGEVMNQKMQLNEAGKMLNKWWEKLNEKFPIIQTDSYVVMPNHFHGILMFFDSVGATPCGRPKDVAYGKQCRVQKSREIKYSEKNRDIEESHGNISALENRGIGRPHGVAPTLGNLIGWFKTMTTNEYIENVKQKKWKPFPGKLWQRNYHEHVIRNDQSLENIREYILHNPLQWDFDPENPFSLKDSNIFERPNRSFIQKEQAFI